MAQAAETPLVLVDPLGLPKYGEAWMEEASRVFHAGYLDYEER